MNFKNALYCSQLLSLDSTLSAKFWKSLSNVPSFPNSFCKFAFHRAKWPNGITLIDMFSNFKLSITACLFFDSSIRLSIKLSILSSIFFSILPCSFCNDIKSSYLFLFFCNWSWIALISSPPVFFTSSNAFKYFLWISSRFS